MNKTNYKLSALILSSFLFITNIICDQHEQVFTHIYDHAVWGKNSAGEGFSGGGSLTHNCRPYIKYLQEFMAEHNITSVVDAGCGDWEFAQHIDWKGIDYMGYDVVTSVIDKNIKRFGTSNIKFEQANIIKTDLSTADLFICKHVLQHLTNEDIFALIEQFSKYKYCIITNEVYPKTLSSDNSNIPIGGSRKIDLTHPPFNLSGQTVLNFRIGKAVHQVFLINNTQ